MKVGIKKIHENEWLVHLGNAAVKLDTFSAALLNITLEHLLALEHGEAHSTLKSYVGLGLKLKQLKGLDMQKIIQMTEGKDLLNLMLVAADDELNTLIIKNMGGILSKQFKQDLQSASMPEESEARESIKKVVEAMFELEAQGKLEIVNEKTRYI